MYEKQTAGELGRKTGDAGHQNGRDYTFPINAATSTRNRFANFPIIHPTPSVNSHFTAFRPRDLVYVRRTPLPRLLLPFRSWCNAQA